MTIGGNEKKVEIMIRRSARSCEEMKRKKLKRRRETEESRNNDNEETEDGKVRERKKDRRCESEAEGEREETKEGKGRKFVRERMAAKVRMRGSKKKWITMEESRKDRSTNTTVGGIKDAEDTSVAIGIG